MGNRFYSLVRTGASIIFGTAIGLVFSTSTHADLAQTPLEVSSFVDPNVMLLLDDSGSMRSTIWDDDFDPNFDYPSWDLGGVHWNPDQLFAALSHYFAIGPACPAPMNTFQWIRGHKGGSNKCIKVPDPEGDATRYSDNYVNYLFETYDIAETGEDLTAIIPSDTRMYVALEATRDLVANTPNTRFCVSRFDDSGQGSIIEAKCGTDIPTLETLLDPDTPVIVAGGQTPLAESIFEVVDYFRGTDDSWYRDEAYPFAPVDPVLFNTTAGNPIQYRCQANFLVMITDGFPVNDFQEFVDDSNSTVHPTISRSDEGIIRPEPLNTPVLPGDPDDYSLPNWDGMTQTPLPTEAGFPGNLDPFSDGFLITGENSLEGNTLFIDDLAKYAFDIDLKTFANSGVDLAGVSFDGRDDDGDGQLDHVQQNILTYPVGFASEYQALDDTAVHGGTNLSLLARNSAELTTALQKAVIDIFERTGSAAAATATTSFLSAGDQVFQVTYNSGDWSGKLVSFEIEDDPESADFGQLKMPALWDASENIPSFPNRKILTVGENGSGDEIGVEFLWDNITANQQFYFFETGADVGDAGDIQDAQDVLDYVLGDQSNEVSAGGSDRFRNRLTLMPDVVHADPAYVADQDFGYDDADYQTFLTSIAGRDPIVYVGGNGGLLQGFYAPGKTEEVSPGVFDFPDGGGEERFAFAPKSVFSNIKDFSEIGYQHNYYVDGKPIVVDANIKLNGGSTAAWRSVLVGAMGAGAKGLFALDVTDPAKFANVDSPTTAAEIFLWEVNHDQPRELPADTPLYPDMGHLIDRASVIRVKLSDDSDQWYTITGNGVYSDSGKAVFYAIDMNDETNRLAVILDQNPTFAASGLDEDRNGIVANTAVDIDGDDYVDRVYLTDVQGRIWRLDWDQANDIFVTPFGSESVPEPLFSTSVTAGEPGAGDIQTISTAVEVSRVPGDTESLLVYFGTGKYYEVQDNNPGPSFPTQSFYGILDNNLDHELTKSDLVEQSINATTPSINGNLVRVVSNETVNYAAGADNGWFIDLPENGERVIFESLLIKDRILFTTIIPNPDAATDPCLSGTEGWILEVLSVDGSNPPDVVFDANDDGLFDESDTVVISSETFAPAGIKPSGGAPLPPSIIRIEPGNGEDGELAGFSSTTEGEIIRISNVATIPRTSWRRL